MSTSALVSLIFHVLAGVAVLLWLLWGFIPAGMLFKSVVTVCIVASALWLIWRKNRPGQMMAKEDASDCELPLFDDGGPVVLVCGDDLDALFQGLTLRKTAQGWWLLRASNTQDLLTARAEAADQAALDGLLAMLDAQLAASGIRRD